MTERTRGASPLPPKDEQDRITQMRKANADEFQSLAKVMNADRPWKSKVLFRDRVTAKDLMLEEAHRMNDLITHAVTGNFVQGDKPHTKAMELVMYQPEFKLGGRRKEYVADKTAEKVTEAVDNREYSEAASLILNYELDDDTRKMLVKKVRQPVIKHTADLVEEGQDKDFVQAIAQVGHLVNIARAELHPQALDRESIREEVNVHLVDTFRTFVYSPNSAVGEISKFSNLGLVNKDEVLRSEDIKGIAVNAAISEFRRNPYSLRSSTRLWSDLESIGVGRVEEYAGLPQIKNIAVRAAVSEFTRNPYTSSYRSTWTNLAREGIVSITELQTHPTIRSTATRTAISEFTSNPYTASRYRDLWQNHINKGLLSADEIRSLPQIRQRAREVLLSEARRSYRDYQKYRDQFAADGLINAAEIDAHPSVQQASRRGY